MLPLKPSPPPALQTGSGKEFVDRVRAVRTGTYLLVVLTAGAYLPSPLYPGYQGSFGISDLGMTLIYAVFALVSAPALLLFGPASDALGTRVVLRTAVLLAAAGSVCFAFAAGTGWLLAGRAAQGLALGAVTPAATALICDDPRSASRRRAAVLAGTAFLLGTAAGPVAAGALAQHLPLPQVLPYLLHLVLLGVGWRRLSRLPAPAAPLRRWRPERPRIPRGTRWSFTAAAGTGFLAWTVAGLFLAIVPALLERTARADLTTTGCVLGAVLVCSALTQPFVIGLGPRRAQLGGLGGLLASLVLLAASAGASLPVVLAAAVVAGAGHGLAYGGATAAVEEVVSRRERGAITGALYLACYLGAGFPAVLVGLVALERPLGTATSWVAIAAGALVPVVAVAVAVAGRPTPPVEAPRPGPHRAEHRLDRAGRPRVRGNRCPAGPGAGGRARRSRRSPRPRPAGGPSRPS
ncbi:MULTISPECIES: MFS transporter [unclassified Saccharopolyspora]|uniref:MFS transporter n=1 Tax=unclassified Saccharopolyspora TaxID=2646250 RepID=UPI001CD36421|nr:MULTISPECIES: MFS transporter [unclassified Saccharopolyspora]MCA1187209.1 MFS transporter [Saccharopolyspora sp. 6T]MCA1194331.1 MFS transporter [Saccharopolyspora sp. 6V]MCA1227249.1 MFS transporter [Saccharopolyspora sp. 6M]MCA1283668.1 MFS transporter [Saccharopolyspora sp. 7B]